ncbi:RidA family protein [Peredibacter starrii]|uniref:RidA family protein n=1 Tax=Peredibacter starrii TaxID=28202 RepID=A0AAX4HTF8_9BACT|nr:RidA family protein [Peredibacter starrii]WPU66506.1 RidA family protein [Peredibacter starrii]
MFKREAIFPRDPHALYEQHGYSPAVKSGDLLFVSGQVGARKDGTPEPDIQKQVQLAFDNLNSVLSAAGCSFENVVDVTIFIVDPEKNFEKIFPVFQKNWGEKPFPTVTAVGVTWLSGFLFEIKVIAQMNP